MGTEHSTGEYVSKNHVRGLLLSQIKFFTFFIGEANLTSFITNTIRFDKVFLNHKFLCSVAAAAGQAKFT